MSARYARPSKPPKNNRPRLSRLQIIAASMTILVVCALIGGVTGSIILDARKGNDSSGSDGTNVNSDDLLKEMRDTAAANPQSAEAQAALANYLANTGGFEESISYYEKAIAIDPSNWVIRLDFAQALMNNGKLADSEYQFDQILSSDPQNAQAWFYLGQLYQKWTPPRDDEAIFAYQQVIRYDPESFIASEAARLLTTLGIASPVASPLASPEATP